MSNENKVIVKVYVPTIEQEYDIWIPLNKRMYNVVKLITEAVGEFTGGDYEPKKMPSLYNRRTSEKYDVNLTVKESAIINGEEIILI